MTCDINNMIIVVLESAPKLRSQKRGLFLKGHDNKMAQQQSLHFIFYDSLIDSRYLLTVLTHVLMVSCLWFLLRLPLIQIFSTQNYGKQSQC